MIGAEIVGGAESFESGAPKDVCRRNNDPNTRLFFVSSDVLDANEPVLEMGDFSIFLNLRNFRLPSGEAKRNLNFIFSLKFFFFWSSKQYEKAFKSKTKIGC